MYRDFNYLKLYLFNLVPSRIIRLLSTENVYEKAYKGDDDDDCLTSRLVPGLKKGAMRKERRRALINFVKISHLDENIIGVSPPCWLPLI